MNNTQKTILILTLATITFFIVRKKPKKSLEVAFNGVEEKDPKERTPIKEPTMSKKDAKANPTATKAFKCLQAYIKAYNSGESQKNLDKLNAEMSNEVGMVVYRRRQDNKLCVKYLNGKDIIVNND